MSEENVEIVRQFLATFVEVDEALEAGLITRARMYLNREDALKAAGLSE
jgi:hypothetical protein